MTRDELLHLRSQLIRSHCERELLGEFDPHALTIVFVLKALLDLTEHALSKEKAPKQ